VIASQALITGAFSVTKQVIQLGYLPRLHIQHTSVKDTGQIYMPFVNWGLFVLIVLAVVMFRSSSNLAAAYGIAVTLDMLITTVLTFLSSAMAGAIRWRCALPPRASSLSSTWRSSRPTAQTVGWRLVPAADRGRDVPADDDLEAGARPAQRLAAGRCASTCKFPGGGVREPARARGWHGRVPDRRARHRAQRLLHNLKHNKVLHENNLFVTVRNHEVPWIGMDKRLRSNPWGTTAGR
jgi:KUP system potassium uptake protein